MRWIRPEKREKVVARGSHSCIYCLRSDLTVSETPDGGKPAPDAANLDHITPRSWYRARGTKINNKATNLVVACGTCNDTRHDTPIGDWCRVVAGRRLGDDAASSAVEELGAAIERSVRAQARRQLPRVAA